MGRHAAADGAGTDPIVAAALARQDAGPTGPRRATAEGTDQATESGLGWPGDTTTGGGLGWPGSLDQAAAGQDSADEVLRETTRMDAVPALPGIEPVTGATDDDEERPEPPTRRGWRRVFGGTAA